jgi:hypothetical protein
MEQRQEIVYENKQGSIQMHAPRNYTIQAE